MAAAPALGDEHGAVAEPDGYRMDDFRSPVPPTLKGAKVIGGAEAETLFKDGGAIFVDVFPRAPKPPNLPKNTVWRDPKHYTIKGAHWLPNVGYGGLPPDIETYFQSRLASLTGGDKGRPVVIFCQKNCWMSWNAAKRALEYGYTRVIWFSEGTDAWQEEGHDLVEVQPAP